MIGRLDRIALGNRGQSPRLRHCPLVRYQVIIIRQRAVRLGLFMIAIRIPDFRQCRMALLLHSIVVRRHRLFRSRQTAG